MWQNQHRRMLQVVVVELALDCVLVAVIIVAVDLVQLVVEDVTQPVLEDVKQPVLENVTQPVVDTVEIAATVAVVVDAKDVEEHALGLVL